MDVWEYQSFLTNGPSIEQTLNKAGAEGWEVVTAIATTYRYEDTQPNGVTWTPTQWGVTQYRVILKRRRAG